MNFTTIKKFFKLLANEVKKRGSTLILFKESFSVINKMGLKKFYGDILKKLRTQDVNFITSYAMDANKFQHDPLITVLIVAYKSCKDLIFLFDSLERQSYKKFEIIIVQNDSEDLSFLVDKISNKVRIINSGNNIGFAAANNIGVNSSSGELVCIVNPDTVLDNDCLLILLTELRHDPLVGVSVPKIRFWERFVDLVLEMDCDFKIHKSTFDDSLIYKKWFLVTGINNGDYINSDHCRLVLRVPAVDSNLDFNLISETDGRLSIGYERAENNRARHYIKYALNNNFKHPIVKDDMPSAAWVINNAGSGIRAEGPYDIGFGQYDYGNFDQPCYVQAMCGCVAMIRRNLLINQKLFIDQFFAYYEDSEFSTRLANDGVKIKYCPTAIVRHKHSASSQEGSIMWTTLVNRSKNIYNTIVGTAVSNFSYLNDSNYNEIPPALREMLINFDHGLIDSINNEELRSRNIKTIGIYNSYWNTFGGGELHALAVALKLGKGMEIWLISEHDFNIESLEKYYGLNLMGFKKLVSPVITPDLTSKFDVFINSTYNSNLLSLSSNSFYLVSFPHRFIHPELLSAYTFIHNSNYTKMWAEEYWASHNSKLLYPVLHYEPKEIKDYVKEKIILNVGRFTERGHAKRQDFIIKAFSKLCSRGLNKDFKLIFCGTLDQTSEVDTIYFEKLKKLAEGYPVEFYPNCDKQVLNSFYDKSLIYVHAAGVDIDGRNYPEKIEHFGIAVFDAIYYGCVPIVYEKGGPAELCLSLNIGYLYKSEESLISLMTTDATWSGINPHSIIKSANDFLYKNNITSILLQKFLNK
jgi:GT2 family glycosyltransferase